MKVAILGAVIEPDHPVFRKQIQRWTIGKRGGCAPVDRLYELHTPNEYNKYRKNLDAAEVWQLDPTLPGAFPIPAELIKKISDYGLTSSIAWMVAHAIVEGAKEIMVYGCPFSGPSHMKLRAGVAYWLGIARAKGIKVSGDLELIGEGEYGAEW